MTSDEQSGWECRFCSEKLKPQPLLGWRRLFWIVPVREFRCPHCFNTFKKPVAVIAAIPLVGGLFCEKRGVSVHVAGMISGAARRGKSRRRNYVNASWVVRFGRWTGSLESKVSGFISRIIRAFVMNALWPFHWLSREFLKSKVMSRNKYRSRSDRRPRSHDHEAE